MDVTRGDIAAPQHIGKIHELEEVSASSDTGLRQAYLYGVGEDTAFFDHVRFIVDGQEVSFDGHYLFEGFEDLFIVDEGGEFILTNVAPAGFDVPEPATEEYEVAIEDAWGSEYVKMDGEWYGGGEAGNVYMQGRRDRLNQLTPVSPPDSAEGLTVTLYEPNSGGGTFWASCGDKVGSGDMPEEAMTAVVH